SQRAHQGRPADPAGRIEERELEIWHAVHASEQGRGRAQEGHETAQEDGLPSVALKESAALVQLAVVQPDQPTVTLQEPEPSDSPNPVSACVAGYRTGSGCQQHTRDR